MQRLRRLLLRLAATVIRTKPGDRPPRRLLIIKPDHLGDVVLLTPALHWLREVLPDTHLTLLIGPWSADAVHGISSFDTLLFCTFPGFTRRPKPSWLQPYLILFQTALLLRSGHYDTALIARDDHWWGALLALVAGIPRRVGFAAPDVGPLLTDALPYNPKEHVAVQALQLVAYLTGQPLEHSKITLPQQATRQQEIVLTKKPSILASEFHAIPPITLEDAEWADRWLDTHDLKPCVRLIAVHPGAGGAAKHWITSRWAMIIDSLMADGWQVLVTGGPAERVLVNQIIMRLMHQPLTLTGEAKLGQLAALYRRCTVVVGVDSGPLHLARAAGTPTVTLYGPIDPHRFGPWGVPGKHHIVRSGIWCSPCNAVDKCPRGTSPAECMTQIGVSQVLEAIETISRKSTTG